MSESFIGALESPEREDLAVITRRLESEFAAMAGKHLLVTGGAGFLGYYLVRSLLYSNDLGAGPPIEITLLDNFRRGLPRWLMGVGTNPHLNVLRHDMTDPLPADLADVDFIVHAASIASPTYYRRDPVATMDANVGGLRHLLDYSRDRAERGSIIEGLLFFSTSEVYGDPTPGNIPTPESYLGSVSCTGPRACYDESKRYGETLCVNFAAQYGLPIRVVRPFNNYGPGLRIDDGRLLSDFAGCVLAGRDVVLYSDGSPTRTFCYIADAIVGYYKVLVNGRDGDPYNIGADSPEISVGEIAERVIALAGHLFGYEGRIVHHEHPDRDYLTGNPSRRCPNIDKARRELAFEPQVSLVDGLTRMLLWYKSQPAVHEVS